MHDRTLERGAGWWEKGTGLKTFRRKKGELDVKNGKEEFEKSLQ